MENDVLMQNQDYMQTFEGMHAYIYGNDVKFIICHEKDACMHGMGHTFHWQLLLDNKLRA
jgi:hypothetical protein